MPSGDKSKYTNQQKRQAERIEEGYKKRGVSEREAESRAWATVNKRSGGGKKGGSGRRKKGTQAASRQKKMGGKRTSSRSTHRSRTRAKKSRSG